MASDSKSPLQAAEQAAGAVRGAWAGVDVALHFDDPAAEAGAAAEGAISALSHRATLELAGPDARDFLQNLSTQDCRALEPGGSAPVAFLTKESRVVANGSILCVEDGRFLVDVFAPRLAALHEHLDRHLVAEDVELELPATGRDRLAILAPEERLRSLLGDAIPDAPGRHSTIDLAGSAAIALRPLWCPRPGIEVVAAEEDLATLWTQALETGLRPAGIDLYDGLRLLARRSIAGVDFDDRTLALEAGIDDAIHLSKGCYLGQEIVERQYSRGKRNRALAFVEIAGDRVPDAGSPIRSGDDEAGVIAHAARAPEGRIVASAMLRRGFFDPFPDLEVDLGDARARATPLA